MEKPGFQAPWGIPVRDFEQKDGVFLPGAMIASSLDGGMQNLEGSGVPRSQKLWSLLGRE